MLLIVGILIITTGRVLYAAECDFEDFSLCLREVVALETGDFDIVSEESLKEVCNSKRQAIQCASDYIQNCMKKGEIDLYEVVMGGKLKVVEEMCSEGTKINKGFVQHMSCFGKLQDEINFCNNKFKESQEALSKANMIHRLKSFYGCCAFEWHRNCLAKAARTKCSEDAADFIYYVSTALGGKVQNHECSSSYASCHGLHGVEDAEGDAAYDNNGATTTDAANSMTSQFPGVGTLPLFLAWLMML